MKCHPTPAQQANTPKNLHIIARVRAYARRKELLSQAVLVLFPISVGLPGRDCESFATSQCGNHGW